MGTVVFAMMILSFLDNLQKHALGTETSILTSNDKQEGLKLRYTASNSEFDSNSTINQSIKGKFVERNVCACVTSMVNYIIGKQYMDEDREGPFEIDDIENFFSSVCPKCNSECGFTEVDAYKCDCCEAMHETEEDTARCSDCPEALGELAAGEEPAEHQIVEAYKCGWCGHLVEDTSVLNEKPQEVFEWWICSNWMMEKLRARGEVVIPHLNIWGRTTTGQAILLDGIISRICQEMGILDGQVYSWKEA